MDKNILFHWNIHTLWLFNIAVGNGPFLDDFPTRSIRVYIYILYIPSGYLI